MEMTRLWAFDVMYYVGGRLEDFRVERAYASTEARAKAIVLNRHLDTFIEIWDAHKTGTKI